MSYGRQILTNNATFPTRVSADGHPLVKPGGVTIDNTTLSAASGSDTTLADGSIIKAGWQYLRYGQVICKITDAGTITETGVPTGGTYTLVVTAGGTSQTTATIAQAATAATVQAALTALTNVGTGNATVSGSAGGPYTVTFADALGTVSVALGTNSLTGGTSPSVTVTAGGIAGTNAGKFGPYDSAATDGRQTLTPGNVYVLDETYLVTPSTWPLNTSNEIIGGAIEGGLVWRDRIIQAGTGTHSLAAGPTYAELVAALPNLRYAAN